MDIESHSVEQEYHPRLYSAGGIRLLSLLFSAIAGGVMTAQNLKNLSHPQAARKALWGSIAYTLIVTLTITLVLPGSRGNSWLGLITGFAGGLGLEAYFKRFVSNWNTFPVKSNTKPFLVCLLIIGLGLTLTVYLSTLKQP